MWRIDEITGAAGRVSRGDGRLVLSRCHVADRPVARAIGLLGTRKLEEGEGVLIRPCAAVHTLGMRYPLGVVFLDGEGRVVAVRDPVPPWRGARFRGATSVLEAAAGTFSELAVGARLRLEIVERH